MMMLRTWSQVIALAANWQIPSGTMEKPRKGQQQIVCLSPAMAGLCGIRSFTVRWHSRGLFEVSTTV